MNPHTHPDLYLYAVSAMIESGEACRCEKCSDEYAALFSKFGEEDTLNPLKLTPSDHILIVRALDYALTNETLTERAASTALRHIGYLPSIRPHEYRLLRAYALKAKKMTKVQHALAECLKSIREQMDNQSETIVLSIETAEQFGLMLKAGPTPEREHLAAHTALVNRLLTRPPTLPAPSGPAASA